VSKMNADKQKSLCVSKERLSAHFDGELKLEKNELQHLKHCGRCSSILNEFAYLEKILKKNLDSVSMSNLNEKIMSRIKTENHSQSILFKNFHIISKVASFILVAGFIAAFIFNYAKIPARHIEKSQNQHKATSNKLTPQSEIENEIVFLGDSPEKNVAVKNQNIKHNGNIDYLNFSRVSTGVDQKTLPALSLPKQSQRINPRVEHIWIADKPEKALDFIKKSLHGSRKFNIKLKNGLYHITFKINKLKLVELVKKLHNAGYKLISPDQPQPEQILFPGHSNDNVLYHAAFTAN